MKVALVFLLTFPLIAISFADEAKVTSHPAANDASFTVIYDGKDLSKIDTEGNDREVILTLADIIFEYRPVVMFECFKRAAKAERFGLFEIFDREDYILFNTDAPTVPLRRADMTKWRHFDVVAEPKDRPTAPLSS